MKTTPTVEQQDILNTFKNERVLKVLACAGSGKSTTLRMLAEHNNQKSLYLCFNKSVAEEARTKFPQHVDCRTTHSLAFAKHGVPLMHKLNRPVGRFVNVAGTPSEIAKHYNIKPWPSEVKEITAVAVASMVRNTVNIFQNSSEEQISVSVVPQRDVKDLKKAHPDVDIGSLVQFVIRAAKQLWSDRINPKSVVLATHDTYLKLWQLSKPTLDYEILYVDEAQDSNPTVLDVVKNQMHCKIVYVGDTHQSIYAFRRAVNAMEMIEAPTKELSQSFRYGQEIADIASAIIEYAMDIKGAPNIESKVQKVKAEKYTMLFRTNAALLDTAVKLISKGVKVRVEIDVYDFVSLLKSTAALWASDSKNVKHTSITPYSSWEELVEASNEDVELLRLVKIAEKNKINWYIKSLESLDKKSTYDVFMTTAHKSKGKEWSNVIVADDFPIGMIANPEIPNSVKKTQEINLLYVACTRAIDVLQLPKDMIVE